MKKHIINTNLAPFIPSKKLLIRKHQCMGILEFNPDDIYFHKIEGLVRGGNLVNSHVHELALNATVLDYLLIHPEIIPEECKERATLFLGTLYTDGIEFSALFDRSMIRILYFDNKSLKFDSNLTGLYSLFGSDFQIAFLKNYALSPEYRFWERE